MTGPAGDDDGLYGDLNLSDGGTFNLTLGINLMISGQGHLVDSVDDARFLICGNKEDGFFEVDLVAAAWRPFVYH